MYGFNWPIDGFTGSLLALTATRISRYWFSSILIAVFFLGSVQLISIGILGEYIGRIYEEVKGRPAYTIAEIAGLEIN